MTLADLGSIGEFVGSIAVLVTLAYLAIQIRHSRELLERNEKLSLGQAFQARIDSRRELERLVIDMSEVIAKVEEGGFSELSASDKIRLRHLHSLWSDFWDNVVYQSSLGFSSAVDTSIDIDQIERVIRGWELTGVKPTARVEKWIAAKKQERGRI